MKSKLKCAIAGAALLLLGARTPVSGQTGANAQVAGMYRIVSATDLGPQLAKLSLKLHLINQSADSVRLSNLVFLPARPVPAERNSAALRIQPVAPLLQLRSTAAIDLEKDVVVSRQEYLASRHARVLHFQATIQNADGTTQTQMLMLLAEPFSRAK